jgi:hypothetical protein
VAAGLGHLAHVGIQRLDRIGCATIGRHAKWIGALDRQQGGRLTKSFANPAVASL